MKFSEKNMKHVKNKLTQINLKLNILKEIKSTKLFSYTLVNTNINKL